MKKIDISTKKYPDTFALVDDEDYERINKYKWHPHNFKNGSYAERFIPIKGMRSLKISMSREIIRYVGDKIVDHKDLNTLNNQKKNLRLCTKSQNAANTRKPENNTSGYKGVAWHKASKKWMGHLGNNYKHHYLGLFTNKQDAAKAYNKKALELFGEFANLNIIEGVTV